MYQCCELYTRAKSTGNYIASDILKNYLSPACTLYFLRINVLTWQLHTRVKLQESAINLHMRRN